LSSYGFPAQASKFGHDFRRHGGLKKRFSPRRAANGFRQFLKARPSTSNLRRQRNRRRPSRRRRSGQYNNATVGLFFVQAVRSNAIARHL
jgi:hypothetical protein